MRFIVLRKQGNTSKDYLVQILTLDCHDNKIKMTHQILDV